MPAQYVPLSLDPDFRLALLNWLSVTEDPISILVPGIRKNEPRRWTTITPNLAASGTDSNEILAFRCGHVEQKYEAGMFGFQKQYGPSGLSPGSQVLALCMGDALNRFVEAAANWEKAEKAKGYDVDALEELGENMVGVVNTLAELMGVRQRHKGEFSPPCWSPRWDDYIRLGRMPTKLERVTGTVYDYMAKLLIRARAGQRLAEVTDPSRQGSGRSFLPVYRKLREDTVLEDRLDDEEAKAVAYDKKEQIDLFWRGVKSFNQRVRSTKERTEGTIEDPATRFPTKSERELKILLPDEINIADFSKSWRERRDK